MRSCRRALTIFFAIAVSWAPFPLLAEDWSSTRPDDLSRFSLKSIEFEGNFQASGDELHEVIETSASGFMRLRPVNIERIERDVIKLRNHFRHEGFWNVRVGRELFFDHQRRVTKVRFQIDEGAQRIVGRVSVAGEQTYPAEEILGWTGIQEGAPFDLSKVSNDRLTIENQYANQGFYEVRVIADIQAPSESTEPAGELPVVHDLVFRIEEGPRFIVGRIEIEGNRFTDGKIIRRELTIETGKVLNRELLIDSRARLYSTGYFSRVNLIPRTESASKGMVDVLVRVEERKMRFVGLGLGYGTRDQLRISGEWGHRNLWGSAKRATIRSILATELFPADLVRVRLEGRYVEPWLFNTRTTGTSELFYERRREPYSSGENNYDYDLSLVGLIVNVTRQLTRFTRAWVSLENEWADVDADRGQPPPPDDSRPDVTRTLSTSMQRDRRDDFFEPKKGFFNRITGSVSGGILGGDNHFWKTQIETSWFRDAMGVTLAGRVRLGYERPFGDSARPDPVTGEESGVPDRLRFKIGGSTTVRGYREQDIGGGDFLILANFETRFPLIWILGGAFFLDSGNAWQEVGDVSLKDFRIGGTKGNADLAELTEVRYSAGAGLRFATPVGPVRFDYGHKLKRLSSDEERWRIHVSLGHVF